MLKFQNKTVLVTGSGTGIGQAITKKFVENGASAIILGRRKEPLEETAKMLEGIIKEKQSNATIKIFDGVDVSDEKAVTGMFDSLKSENVNLDVVVNNAGVSGPVTCFAHAPLDQFRSTVDIHLTGTFWTSVQALKVMKEGSKNYYNFNIFCGRKTVRTTTIQIQRSLYSITRCKKQTSRGNVMGASRKGSYVDWN